MALEGTIKDFGLPDIFQLIGLQRKTGLLTLNNEKDNVTVTFENGMVVMADQTSKRLEDRLGNVLVKQGKLSKDRLDEALQTQKATLQRLGHVLVAQNYITAKDLRDAIQVQISQTVFKVFRWRDGEYHFAPSDSVEWDRDSFQPLSADFILMEGIRMVDEWPIIEKKIPSMDIVFRTVVDPSLIEVAAGSGGGGVEEVLAGMAEGTKRSAASSTGLGEFDTCRILFDLLNRNLVSTVGRGVTRETEASPAARVASATPGYVLALIALVLAAAGVLAHWNNPFAVSGLPPLLGGSYNLLMQGVSHVRLERLDRAILAHHLSHGSVPRTLEDLVAEGLVDRSYLKDPWARPFHYALTESGYLLSGVDDTGRTVPPVIERVLPLDKP